MANSTVMVKVANDGDIGTMEIQDILFTVKGGTQGAVLVEWNANQAYQGAVGMWGQFWYSYTLTTAYVAIQIVTSGLEARSGPISKPVTVLLTQAM